jgi:hypothetical protein
MRDRDRTVLHGPEFKNTSSELVGPLSRHTHSLHAFELGHSHTRSQSLLASPGYSLGLVGLAGTPVGTPGPEIVAP